MIVVDTHVLVWWVSDPGRLSPAAKRAIDRRSRKDPIVASTITVLELATAARRGRLELDSPFQEWLADVAALPDLRFEPVSVEIARLAGTFEETLPGDPADRIIVATARALGVKLVTADARLKGLREIGAVW